LFQCHAIKEKVRFNINGLTGKIDALFKTVFCGQRNIVNPSETISILGISGSLRRQSSNAVILRAVTDAAQARNVPFTLFEGIDELPHFNPDIMPTPAVAKLRAAIERVDAIVISTPEYAFGVPGALKNALDWLVATGELNEKPVAAISSSSMHSGGDKALSSLQLTLKALGTDMNEHSSLSIASAGQKITQEAITDATTLQEIQDLIDHLLQTVHNARNRKTQEEPL
jgi:NAD(P)H-dependent FMN reductase